jgi:hypothetical protein
MAYIVSYNVRMYSVTVTVLVSQSQSYITTDGQSVCLGVEPNLELLTRDIFFFFSKLLSCLFTLLLCNL